jgi:hypothetical protein
LMKTLANIIVDRKWQRVVVVHREQQLWSIFSSQA